MISSEVQRTLVKSPPELWAELSDPAALARHLSELGEIKITRIEPEQTVEWEAEAAKGKVQLKPSGWGTKVTLSVTQESPDSLRDEEVGGADSEVPESSATERTSDSSPEAQQDAEPKAETIVEVAGADDEPHATEEPAEPRAVEVANPDEQPPRQGFFARLFRRKARVAQVTETDAAAAAVQPEPEPATIEPEPVAAVESEAPAAVAPEPSAAIEPEPPAAAESEALAAAEPEPADLSAELAAAEEALVAQTTEMLTLVLDRLGAAHHRPFSRA